MKKLLFFALLFCTTLGITSAHSINQDQPDYVIIEDQLILLTPNNYMSAQYVYAELLDANGNVQASTTTTPGRTVSFVKNDASTRVRSTYYMDGGQQNIIIDLINGY